MNRQKVDQLFQAVEHNNITGEEMAQAIANFWGTQELEQFLEHLSEEGFFVEGLEEEEED